MAANNEIIIPYCPRCEQATIHAALETHRFAVLVAHRRMGKTVCVINHLIKQALTCKRKDGQGGAERLDAYPTIR